MISDEEYNAILKEVDFEFPLSSLKTMLDYETGARLYKFLIRYRMNIRDVYRMRMASEGDEREQEISEAFEEIEGYFPDIEFTSEAIYGSDS